MINLGEFLLLIFPFYFVRSIQNITGVLVLKNSPFDLRELLSNGETKINNHRLNNSNQRTKEMFNFEPDKLIETESLGKGFSGQVFPYKSKEGPNGEKWAVKVEEVNFEGLRRAMQEIAVGFKCQHDNILPISGFDIKEAFVEKNGQKWIAGYKVYIKMPRMKQNLLAKYIQQNGQRFSELQILGYFYGIVCGLMALHKEEIAHKDIKPENILLDENGIIKIADIGLAKCLENDIVSMSTVDIGGGTVGYIAPEILRAGASTIKKELHLKSDLWSLGVTILELCLLERGALAFDGLDGCIQSVKLTYSDKLATLIRNLLQYEPDKRIRLEDLVKKLEDLLVI